jgi:hypothetical protein
MLIEILAYLWWAMMIIPAFFWFFIIREFNKKTKAHFPSFVYPIFYLIPLVHYFISWSFIHDIREAQNRSRVSNPLSVFKTFLWKLALPYFFLTGGLYITTLIGTMLILVVPIVGEAVVNFATWVPYISFIWLAFGFWSLMKTIKSMN